MPISIRNLEKVSISIPYSVQLPSHSEEPPLLDLGKKKDLTACGEIFPSSPISHAFVLSISMTPSITAWPTCTPFGPYSLAKLCAIALTANFMVAKAAKLADPFIEAVAPV